MSTMREALYRSRANKAQEMVRRVQALLQAGESVLVVLSDRTERIFRPGDEFPPPDLSADAGSNEP